jgi:hypothetical protein
LVEVVAKVVVEVVEVVEEVEFFYLHLHHQKH